MTTSGDSEAKAREIVGRHTSTVTWGSDDEHEQIVVDCERSLISAISSALDDAVRGEREVWEAALTPNEETKFTYMGEVNFHHTDFDEDGNEHRIRLDVPWISIKELMKLIRGHAAAIRSRGDSNG